MCKAVGATNYNAGAAYHCDYDMASKLEAALGGRALQTSCRVFSSKNYRGVHLTSQISKVAERLIKPMIEPHLERLDTFGINQFAYRTGRGCRDALALLTMHWIFALSGRAKVAVYCSDVSGGFDRVCSK